MIEIIVDVERCLQVNKLLVIFFRAVLSQNYAHISDN
jgi:hypothetical protein